MKRHKNGPHLLQKLHTSHIFKIEINSKSHLPQTFSSWTKAIMMFLTIIVAVAMMTLSFTISEPTPVSVPDTLPSIHPEAVPVAETNGKG